MAAGFRAMSTPVLHTERLVLRPFTPSDEETLFRLWNDADVRRFLWDDQPVARETVREQIAQSQADFRERGHGLFLVERADAVIGAAGLFRLPGEAWVELIYALLPSAWGQGLATEAARAVLRFGFESAGLEEILAGADLANAASLRVIERLGMTGEHERVVGPARVPVRYRRMRREDFAG
jgi:ribosomal-protein-alanine N-acetyltransferase